jgi:glycosyltransferase involved in cell wall biosynthesis
MSKIAGQTGPMRVVFMVTSMETGGAELLLVNLMRTMDRSRFAPELVCLKHRGNLGETLAREFPVHSDLIHHKFDAAVIGRLTRLLREPATTAVVTVGAGDKMFWGRLAARRAGVPVILAALHSTGWPDGVGRLNRLLTPITDAFIAVAEPHRDYLVRQERFPAHRVRLIPNGIDTERFTRDRDAGLRFRDAWRIPADARVCGIVAALRPEKNHELFLAAAESVASRRPDAYFLVVGDGPRRALLESIACELACADRIRFTGNCEEIPAALSAMDLFSLTSHNEASPVSILEAMSCELPVVAPSVGSIDQAVIEGSTGLLVPPGDVQAVAAAWLQLLEDPVRMRSMGEAGRRHVIDYGSLKRMTRGYMDLIEEIWSRKMLPRGQTGGTAAATPLHARTSARQD